MNFFSSVDGDGDKITRKSDLEFDDLLATSQAFVIFSASHMICINAKASTILCLRVIIKIKYLNQYINGLAVFTSSRRTFSTLQST